MVCENTYRVLTPGLSGHISRVYQSGVIIAIITSTDSSQDLSPGNSNGLINACNRMQDWSEADLFPQFPQKPLSPIFSLRESAD